MAYSQSQSQSQSQSTSDFAIDDRSISASIGNELAQTARAIHGSGVVADLVFQESQDVTSDLDDNIRNGDGAGEGAGDGGHESDDEDLAAHLLTLQLEHQMMKKKVKRRCFTRAKKLRLKEKKLTLFTVLR